MIRRHRTQPRGPRGFTLTELMLVVVLIGVVGGVAVNLMPSIWRRDRLTATAVELQGWLEEIARVPERSGSSCLVTVQTGSRAVGSALATVSPSSCSPQPTLLVPASLGQGPLQVQATPSSWSFTPRGAVDLGAPLQIRLVLGGQPPLRCLQVGAALGLLQLGGAESSTDLSQHCPVPAEV